MTHDRQRQLLILDLDETLIHAKAVEERHELPPPDIQLPAYHIWRRPYLAAFIETLTGWFDIAVWTSSNKAYAEVVVPHLFPDPQQLRFVWTRMHCTQYIHPVYQHFSWRKNLDKVKRRFQIPLERVLMLDDSPEKLDRHYGNLLPILPFEGDMHDTELRDILPYLDWIRTMPNVRILEKRMWRSYRREEQST
jgi:TFIIF-interacting CTD phosphatase-like protein